MSASDDLANTSPALAVVPDEPRTFRPGELADEADAVGVARRVERQVCELTIKVDSVLDFLRRDREERIEDRERLNQLERDIIEHRKQLTRRKAARK